jgi:signal transduction histidine kinase
LFTAIVNAIVLLVADLFGTFEHGPAAFVKYVAVCCLFELAVRRPWQSVAAAMTVLATVYTLHTWEDLPGALPSLLYRIAITIAVPALLGAYIRAARTLAWQTRQRAEEERFHHAARVQAAVIAERTALARELHDLVAHHVSAMVLRVGVARHVVVGGDCRVAEVLDDLHGSGTAALADLRRLVAVLRDPGQAPQRLEVSIVEPDGLPSALAAVAEHSRAIGVTVNMLVDPQIVRVDPLRGRTVLRLAQEGLANVARHAGPSAHARLSAHVADSGEVHLRIVDDGGSRPAVSPAFRDLATGEGFGLIGMRERVERLGGRFQAGPVDGGWELTAILPADGTYSQGARS